MEMEREGKYFKRGAISSEKCGHYDEKTNHTRKRVAFQEGQACQP
jgi:hypothetical protein